MPTLDRQALTAYRTRLRDLEDDITEADTNHDLDRAGNARIERDALIAELTRSVGHHGRPRRLGDDNERARKTTTARIRRAIQDLDTYHHPLADHLRQAIRTGTTCSYEPALPTRWDLRGGHPPNQ